MHPFIQSNVPHSCSPFQCCSSVICGISLEMGKNDRQAYSLTGRTHRENTDKFRRNICVFRRDATHCNSVFSFYKPINEMSVTLKLLLVRLSEKIDNIDTGFGKSLILKKPMFNRYELLMCLI